MKQIAIIGAVEGKNPFLMKDILDRAERLNLVQETESSRMTLLMDIDFTDEIIPLDLDQLSQMDDANFAHDITGIQYNFNRVTKQMDDCFLPRCAKPQPKEE